MGGSCSTQQDPVVPGELDTIVEKIKELNLPYPLDIDLCKLNKLITHSKQITEGDKHGIIVVASNMTAPYFMVKSQQETQHTSSFTNQATREKLHYIGSVKYTDFWLHAFGTRVPLSQNGGYKKVKKYKKTNTKHSFIYQGKSYIRNIHIGSRGGKYVILNKTYVKLNINSS